MPASRQTKTRPGYLRIIGGQWRRQRIAIPSGVELRPTPDRVRETVFNWLAPVLPGARCLDLFAGTGAMAFEALSRGAASAVLVENNRAAAAALKESRDTLGARAEIVSASALDFLARPVTGDFDIVFVDPPYALRVEPVLAALPRWLRPDARIYLERERGDLWPESADFSWLRQATAGAVAYGLARYLPANDV